MKPFLIFFLSSMMTFVLFGQPINDDLLLYYSFNGDAQDQSDNNFSGIPYAALSIDRFGTANSAYSFDGFGQYIDLPNHQDLKPQLPVTISTWVKFDEIAADQTTIFTSDYAFNSHSGVWINTSSTGLFTANFGDHTGNTSSGNRRTKVGETELNAQEWYHLTAVVRGANDMDLYVNCKNDGGSYSGSGGSIGYSSSPGSIGRKDSNMSGPEWYFSGSVDEFKYWSRALTETEVIGLCRTADVDKITFSEDDSPKYSVHIFPNPSQNSLNLETDFEGTYEVQIISLEGKKINNFTHINDQVDISQLTKGVYFINISGLHGQSSINTTVRFVKL